MIDGSGVPVTGHDRYVVWFSGTFTVSRASPSILGGTTTNSAVYTMKLGCRKQTVVSSTFSNSHSLCGYLYVVLYTHIVY